MSSTHSRPSIVSRLTALVLLMLLASVVAPPVARTYWESPPIAKDGPKDPGTPFEEPEGGSGDETGATEPTPPEGIQGDGGTPTASPISPAAPRLSGGSSWTTTASWMIYRFVRFGL